MVETSTRAGSLPQLDAEGLQAARANFLEDIHAPSQRHVVKAKLQTVERALAMWQLTPFPPSVEKVPEPKGGDTYVRVPRLFGDVFGNGSRT